MTSPDPVGAVRPAGGADRAAGLWVALVWAGAVTWAAVLVLRFASPVPAFDDLDTVVHLLERGVSARWLLAAHNEHRIVLPRLVYAGLLGATDDVRAVMLLQVGLLGLLAAAQVLVAARLRGRVAHTDAFFPLLWLHGGHAANLLTAFSITLGLPTVLASAALLVVLGRPAAPGLPRALALAACLVLLPLCSAVGVAQAPALAGWALLAALTARRAGDAPGARRVLGGAALFVALATGAILLTLETRGGAAEAGLGGRLDTAARVLGLAIGTPARDLWPGSGIAVGAVVALSLLPPLVALRRPAERLRAAGLLCAVAATLCVLAGVAWGRGGTPVVGFPTRYAGIATPLLAAAYLAWVAYGSPAVARFAQVTLAAAAVALFGYTAQDALRHGRSVRAATELLVRDARAGLSPKELAAEHRPQLHSHEEGLARGLAALQRHGRPPFHAGGPLPEAPDERPLWDALGLEPAAVRTARPPRRGFVGQTPVLLVHGSTEIDLGEVRGPRRLSGRFGIPAAAYQLNETAGLRFTVELREGRAAFPLAVRELDPRRRPADRGAQPLDAEIAAGRRGRLVLVTRPLAGAAAETDWGFWSGLEIAVP